MIEISSAVPYLMSVRWWATSSSEYLLFYEKSSSLIGKVLMRNEMKKLLSSLSNILESDLLIYMRDLMNYFAKRILKAD